MEKSLVRYSVMLALALGLFVPPAGRVASASPVSKDSHASDAANAKVSPAGFLHADGTLNLDSGFSGSLDVSGWSVDMDPNRGPLFGAPQGKTEATVSTVSPGNWSDLGGGGGGALNDQVTAVAVSGSSVYVGGYFIDAANLPKADYVAKWDGSHWSALGGNGAGSGSLNSTVFALAVDASGNLYVGGYFTDVNDKGSTLPAADYIAKWDGSDWSALGDNGAGNGSLNNPVRAIAVSGTNLYVGGDFTDVHDGTNVLGAADHVAKWDGSHWSALGDNGAGDGSINNAVEALGVDGSGNVYAGGYFTDVNNSGTILGAADYIAKWDGLDWSALGDDGAGGGSLNGDVNVIAVSGTNVYVGGQFIGTNNKGSVLNAASYVAKWDGLDWSALGDNGAGHASLNQGVYAIAVKGSNVYVGGYFTDVNNGGTVLNAADHIAKWNGSNWSALGDNGAGDGSISGSTVYAIALNGSDVYVCGRFAGVNDGGTVLSQAVNIAHWDGSDWSALGAVQGSLTRRVYAVAVNGTDVYVGGDFFDVTNHGTVIPEADYIAKWDGSNWSALGSNGHGNGSLNAPVYAIAAIGSTVYVGGGFPYVNNGGTVLNAASRIAKWNGSDWSALGSDGAGGGSLNGAVYAVAASGSNVYAGGWFTNVKNGAVTLGAASRIAKWDGVNWSALGSDGAGGGSLNYAVNAIAVSGSNVYVGGQFTDVKNGAAILGAADRIAKWDGSNWSALGSNGAGDGSLVNNVVFAIALKGTDLYAGGSFTEVNNGGTALPQAADIAKWDGSNWSALGSNGAGGGSLNNAVHAIALNGTDLYAGGSFTDVNNGGTVLGEADYIAKWDGSDWSALGSDGAGDGSIGGLTGTVVWSLGLTPDALYVGGYFFNVNNDSVVLPYADHAAAYGLVPASVPFLFAPGDTEVLLNRRPSFDWSDVPGASKYNIQISKNTAFTSLEKSTTSTLSAYVPTADLPASSVLYWRVRAQFGGSYGGWSLVHNFKTGNPPSVPSLSSPGNGSLQNTYTPKLDWKDSTIPANSAFDFDHYEVQLATNEGFTTIALDRTATLSEYTIPDPDSLSSNTTYYWRVRVYNTNGEYSAWSLSRTFRTVMLPPTLLLPDNTTTPPVGSPRPLFDWNDVFGATKYAIQISTSSTLSKPVVKVNVVPSAYTPTKDLPAGMTLYWRVQAIGTNGPSDWSDVWQFTTP